MSLDDRFDETGSERIQKILATHGIASRREAEKMILDGRVLVNGEAAVLGQSASPANDDITIDGVQLTGPEEHVYLMLNKPRGFITTVNDEKGRKTVMDLLSDIDVRIYPVGRLDMNSEGLLLFTNDGEFANKVMHPSNNKQKTYEATVKGDVQTAIIRLRQPMQIDDHTVQAVSAIVLRSNTDGGTIRLKITEGRNRQVRKMCTACGLRVLKLKRISIGTLKLGSLKTGQWRHLSKEEVKSLG